MVHRACAVMGPRDEARCREGASRPELLSRHQVEAVREGGEAATLPVEGRYSCGGLGSGAVFGDEAVREIARVTGEREPPTFDPPAAGERAPPHMVAHYRIPDCEREDEAAVARERERDLARGAVGAHVLGHKTVTESGAGHSFR